MYRMTCDGHPLLDARDEALILTAPKVKLADNTVGGGSFKIYKNHPHYDKLMMLKSVFEVSDEFGVIFRGRMTENTRDIKKGKAVDLEGAMAYFNDSIVRPYTFPDDWENEKHPEHQSYTAAATSGNVVEFYLGWLIDRHNAQVAEFQRFKLGTVTVKDPNNRIERASSDYPCAWDELRSKLFESNLGGHLCIRYEADGNYIDYLSEYTEINEQGITYGQNLRDFSQKDDGTETYSAIIPRGAESTSSVESGDSYEGMYGTIVGATSVKKRLTIDVPELPDGNITNDIVKLGDMLYSKKAVAAYGWRFVPAENALWDDVTEPEKLQTKGVEVLEGNATNIPSRIEVKAVDLHCTDKQIRSFRIYKKIPVRILPHDINSDFDITSLDIDLLNPQNTDLVAGKTVMTFTELQKKNLNEVKDYIGKLATMEQLAQGFKVTETLIEKTEEEILLHASELTAINNELNELSESVSEISVTVGEIDLKVAKKTDLDSLSEEVSEIRMTQSNIELNVSATQTALENIPYEGRNLISGTEKPTTVTATGINSYFEPPLTCLLESYQHYTFSADVDIIAGEPTEITLGFFDDSGVEQTQAASIKDGHISCTIYANGDPYLRVYIGRKYSTSGNEIKFSNMKLEKGDKETWWTPAPEDVATTGYVNASLALQIKTDEHGFKYSELNADVDQIIFKTDKSFISESGNTKTTISDGFITLEETSELTGDEHVTIAGGRFKMSYDTPLGNTTFLDIRRDSAVRPAEGLKETYTIETDGMLRLYALNGIEIHASTIKLIDADGTSRKLVFDPVYPIEGHTVYWE